MEKNIKTLYNGYFSPVGLMSIFIAINLIAALIVRLTGLDTNTTWVVFQTVLFFYSTVAITVGVFSKNNPLVYYPSIILLFFLFFTLSKRIPNWMTGVSVIDIPYLQNFVFLNILFFFIFLLASLIYRGAKQAFEKM